MTDSLKIYEILKAGNLPDEHARAVTLAIQKSEIDASVDLKTLIREEFAAFRREIRQELASLEARMDARIDVKVAEAKAEMIRWMFLFWVGQLGITLALVKFGK